ncbi:glycosyltransferase [Halobacillus sp. Nhm2S1]|uniref:glycosyltransferase n=1 Tax=Halobacillus sp. Nhm2S1 TaxID=2866716 RepID=UPI001C738E14|nr:glycosyltransferase [Halobacillus sp. Nhm2S1]MBX0357721.1 glycosyltransferase [Halobacillus sp. Nhm2S1]
MKSIIIVNNNMNIGGIQKSLLNLLYEIKNDYDVTLLLLNKSGEYITNIPEEIKVIEGSSYLKLLGMSFRDSKRLGLKYYFIRSVLTVYTRVFNHYLPIKLLMKTQKRLSEFDYAISFMHSSTPESLYGGANELVLDKINAREKIGFIHCDFTEYGGNTAYVRALYSKFDKVATCSEGCRDKFILTMPECENKTYSVRNSNNYADIMRLAEKNAINYDPDYVNIISVARLSKEKGIERALTAIYKCLSLGYKIRYHIVGDGSQRKELEKLVEDLKISKSVYFYGNTNNPYRYMKNSDLFLLPSYHEAAPMVIDEAKCLGIPVLSTKTTSTKEMIEDNDAGWVCENSTSGILKSLKSILDSKSNLLKIKDSLLAKNYNNKKSIKQFLCLLKGKQPYGQE